MSQHSASSRRRASARRSNFRSIRVEEDALVRRLRSRHTLWLHGGLMGLITLLVMWGVSTALRHGGVDSLAVRYALALGAGYLAYLLLLRIWAGMLVREEERDWLDGVQIDFGSEALLAVAVELAFAYTAARTVVRVEREGWLLAAIRLSWKPLLGALVCAVALGALVDHFVPQADTLAQAVQQWRAR